MEPPLRGSHRLARASFGAQAGSPASSISLRSINYAAAGFSLRCAAVEAWWR